MKISAMSQEYRPATFEEIISRLAQLGFDGVELECGSKRLPAWDIAKAKKLKELCDSKGLAITNLAPQTFFIMPGGEWQTQKELLNVRACCEMASAIDVPYVRVQIISFNFGALPEIPGPFGTIPISGFGMNQYSLGVSTLKEAVKIAEDIGVTLGLDNHFFLTVMDHLRIVKEINSPNLKLFLDTVNAVINGEDVIATARACGELLVHSHLKDMYKYAGTASGRLGPAGQFDVRPPVGQGNVIDWEEYLKTLKDIGYKGFLSIEAAHSDVHYDRWYVAETGLKYLRALSQKVGI